MNSFIKVRVQDKNRVIYKESSLVYIDENGFVYTRLALNMVFEPLLVDVEVVVPKFERERLVFD